MLHPDDVPAMRAALARLEQDGHVEAEYRQRTKSGDYRWISNRMSLTRDAAGGPVYRDGNIRTSPIASRPRRRFEKARPGCVWPWRRPISARGTWYLVTASVAFLRHDQIFGYQELQPEWTPEIARRHVLPEDWQKALDAHTPAEGKTRMYLEGRLRRIDERWLVHDHRPFSL